MSQSAFDDLLDLGGASENVNQSADPFDLLGSSQTTNQNNSITGSSLLDLGFDSEVSTKNVQNSGTVEVNTNPLYEFTKTNNSLDIMASETDNSALLDFGMEPQKEVKTETSSNPLYDFIQSENTNGHADDLLTNGDTQTMDLLDNSTDLLGGENTRDILGGDNIGDHHGDDNTEDLLKGDNTEDLLRVDDSTDLLGGAVTSDDSGVTMDLYNVSESQKEDDHEEGQTEDIVEEQMEQETEEIEEDQDTGNVEEIESEQITEPEIDDQFEDDFKDEVEEGPVNPDIISENTVEETADVEEILDQTSEKPNNPIIDSEAFADKPDDTEVSGESNNPEVDVKAEEENATHSSDEQEDEKANIEDSKSVETNKEEIRADDTQAKSESIEPQPKDECEANEEGESIEVESGFVPDTQNEAINEEVTAEICNDDKEKQELENEKETSDIQVEDVVEKEEVQNTESLPVNVDTTKEETEEDKIKEVGNDMSTEEIESVMQRTEPLMESEDQTEDATEKQKQLELDDTAQDLTEPDTQPGRNEEPEETDIIESEEKPKDEPILEETNDIVTNTENDLDESTEPEMVADDSPTSQAVDNEPLSIEELEVDQVNQSIDPEITEKDVQEPPNEIDFADKAIPDERVQPDSLDIGESDKTKEDAVKQEPVEIKKTEPVEEENAVKLNGANDVKENGVPEDEVIRDPNVYRETREKEEVKFAELNNFREKFETGTVSDAEPTLKKTSIKDEYDEGGEFENTPTVNEDVVKETDQQKEELPEIGMAKNLLNRFKTLQEESSQVKTSQKRESPPRDEKVEYENEPEQRNLVYENKSDEGVFESTPESKEDVVRCGDKSEDVQVEKGYTKNVLSKLKEIETESSSYKAREKHELTPDTSGKVEYVSEPRGEHITYGETKVETGVYENVPKEEEDIVRSGDKAEEVLPESGMAKNLLSKFKQLESETVNQPPPSPKRTTSYEPKSREQKGYLERFSPKLEEGEFENEPVVPKEVVRSGDQQEDFKPESGAAKKTMELFKEYEKTGSSPKAPDYRKEFTPPREASPGKTVAGVLENEPVNRPDVVRNVDKTVDEMPEQGTARNMLEKFKQIQSAENSPSSSPTKKYKEFTPPPESGVYENAPKEHIVIEQIQSESGVLESTPEKSVADIPRQQRETLSPEQELPEKGMAKNLVSKFKQLENESAKNSKSASPSKFKEFTPPRDTQTILSPKSPAGQQNGVHPSDLPEQYQEQTSPGIFESNPEQRKDVYREADTDWEQGLPAKNTTASMLERFKAIQDKAKEDEQSQAPITRKSISKTSGKPVTGVSETEPVNRLDVLQNVDKTDDEMPEQGMTRNIMEKFKQIQSAENSPLNSPTKQYKVLTQTSESRVNENAPKDNLIIEQSKSESGALESTPEKTVADIPRQQRDTLNPEEELPEKGMAKNLVSMFKQLENESAKNSKSASPSKFTQPRDTRTILSPKSPAGQQNGVHPSELPEQYQEQSSPRIIESNPEQKKDVYRESDTDWEQELPAKNTTASMLERFKAMQEKAKEDEQSQALIIRKVDAPSPPVHEEKGMFRVVQTEKCAACQKTVYAMEKLEMSSHIYHKNCFKCSHCSARLTPKSFSMNEGVIYCTNHFKQLFARKGNYDEGFGRQQYKKKWGDDKSKTDDSTATA